MTMPLLDLQKWRSVLVGSIALAALGLAGPTSANSLQPDALVKKLTEDVLATVRSDKEIQSGNINKIQSLVTTAVLPYVNFQKMTASAVGRNWSTATPQQQKLITEQFRQLLVYTYSGALTQVRDQQVQYKPFRADPRDTIAQVNTQIVNSRGGEPVTLDYRLEKGRDGWKIIDVNVLGVWLVQNYRNTFQQEVSKGGIEGLIKALTDKNRSLASSSRPR